MNTVIIWVVTATDQKLLVTMIIGVMAIFLMFFSDKIFRTLLK